jgi:quercetin dioxygenase-like cupin family protein
MKIKKYASPENARRAVMKPDVDYVAVRHILKKGESVDPDRHRDINEVIIISNGKFRISVEGEFEKFDLKNETRAIFIPPGTWHALIAESRLEYEVIKDKLDEEYFV